jgi:5-methylcytosine-specific restriction endonuclease McrA
MAFEFSEEYRTYIKSPKWKLVCQRYWHTYGKKCQACGSRQKLHVHHKSYDRFGRELLTDLTGLCDTCHRAVHSIHRANRRISLRLVTERYVLAKRMGK